MSAARRRTLALPLAVLAALAFNAVLFLSVPLLSSGPSGKDLPPIEQGIFISSRKPPPPPKEEPPKVIKEEKPKPPPRVAKLSKLPKRVKPPPANAPRMRQFEFEAARGLMAGMPVAQPGIASLDGGFEIADVDTPPRVLRGAPPAYPYAAKRRHVEGKVLVRALIQVDGTVTDAAVVESVPSGVFDKAVFKALARWRFKPGMLEGRPVPTWVVIPFEFTLS